MNIQGLGGMQQIAQTLSAGGAGAGAGIAQGLPQGGLPSELSAISNDQGQSLLDIRGELQSAVKDALQNSDGADLRVTIQGAIDATLEANGFDAQEVKGAMEEARFDSMQAGDLSGFDPASLLEGGASEDDVVQAFLEHFRSGANLDLAG